MGCTSSSPADENISTPKTKRRNQTTTATNSPKARNNPATHYHARCLKDGPPNQPKHPSTPPTSSEKREQSLYARTAQPPMPYSTFHQNCCSASPTSDTTPSPTTASAPRNRAQSPSRTPADSSPATVSPPPAKRLKQQPKPAKPTCSDAHEHSFATSPPCDSKDTGNITTVPSVNLQEFCGDLLRAHNAYRQLHGVKPLTLNKQATAEAQRWADQLAANDNMSPNPERTYGENIYSCSGFEPTGHHVVSEWYAEHADHYDFARPVFTTEAAHFTNVIWRRSRQLGAGIARSSTGTNYVVAFYRPPGNVRDNFEQNVPPPKTRELAKQPVHPPYSGRKRCCGKCTEFQKHSLEEHNMLRSRLYAPPLRVNLALCDSAQKWAELLAANNEVSYMGRAPFGQNVHCLLACDATAEGRPIVSDDRALSKWFGERDQYDGRLSTGTAHFTQAVWRSSAELGVGVARSRTGNVYTVAHYFPPGNIEGAEGQNVKHWNCNQ